MDFSGTETISAPREDVWIYLVDMRNVAVCGPGFQSLEEIEPEHWKVRISVGIGLVKVRCMLDVTRLEMHEPDHMLIKAHGKVPGGAVEVIASMQLIALDSGQTHMNWSAHVVVGGTLAHLGASLMNRTAEKLTEQFFACLKAHLQASTTPSLPKAEN